MKNEFIPTVNVQRFNALCEELEAPASLVGPSMAMVTGAAGRGKTEAAKHYSVHNNAVYVPPLKHRTPASLMRDIVFELRGLRPNRMETCLQITRDEMIKERRLVIIDEADELPLSILNMVRNINEYCGCPILMIGEDKLKGKIGSESRLVDRIRRRMEFAPVSQPDIAFFFKKNVGLISHETCAAIHRYANGTWRRVLKFTAAADRAMTASGTRDVSLQMAKEIIQELEKDDPKKRA